MPAVTDIGIDLGTATIIVYVKGKGILLQEPSLVAFDRDENKIRAFGEEAEQMIGHTAGNLMEIRPLREGAISNYVVTERMLQYFIRKSMGHRNFLKPRIVICIPSGITDVERRAVEEATYRAGARDAIIVKAPVVAAMGAGLDIMRPNGNLIVDVGGGITEIASLSLGGIVVSHTLKVAGDAFDDAIVQYARDTHGLYIDLTTAEKLKLGIGSTHHRGDPLTRMEVRGRDIDAGFPRSVTLTPDHIREAVAGRIRQVVQAVRTVMEKTPPDLAADIAERGIVLSGGGAQILGLDAAIERSTGIRTLLCDDPQTAVARGTGQYIRMMTQFERRR